jgi:hypothetical protein
MPFYKLVRFLPLLVKATPTAIIAFLIVAFINENQH